MIFNAKRRSVNYWTLIKLMEGPYNSKRVEYWSRLKSKPTLVNSKTKVQMTYLVSRSFVEAPS